MSDASEAREAHERLPAREAGNGPPQSKAGDGPAEGAVTVTDAPVTEPGGGAPGTADATEDAAAPANDTSSPKTDEGTDLNEAPEGGETPEPAESSELEKLVELRTALAEAERQRDEYLDHLRRERAEFDNFRKRNARERLEAMDRGVQSLLTELLGVLDNFGHVLAAAEDSEDQALATGAAMVHEELIGVLGRFGLEDVPGEGTPFNPQWHEAMMQVAADDGEAEPTVAQVLRSGYRFKGRVLRPASVSVAQ